MHFTSAARRQLASRFGKSPLSTYLGHSTPPRTPVPRDRRCIDRRTPNFKRVYSGAAAPLDPKPRFWRSRPSRYSPLLLFLGSLAFALSVGSPLRTLEAEAPSQDGDGDDGEEKLRTFRLSEVKEHGPKSERPWVIRGNNVYDITDWIAGHPGGEVILRAAGGSVEPYVSNYLLFGFHR
jgi:sulfite oxidase